MSFTLFLLVCKSLEEYMVSGIHVFLFFLALTIRRYRAASSSEDIQEQRETRPVTGFAAVRVSINRLANTARIQQLILIGMVILSAFIRPPPPLLFVARYNTDACDEAIKPAIYYTCRGSSSARGQCVVIAGQARYARVRKSAGDRETKQRCVAAAGRGRESTDFKASADKAKRIGIVDE